MRLSRREFIKQALSAAFALGLGTLLGRLSAQEATPEMVVSKDLVKTLARGVRTFSRGLDPVKVTETVQTLKQELRPDEGFKLFIYIDGINVRAENPSGSNATLSFQLRAVLDDGREVALHDWTSVQQGAVFDDWLRWIYDVVDNGRTITSIRLYAYCSSVPATRLEPTIAIKRVTGLQM